MTASTDTQPTSTKSSSRRALLAGALGGIGAVAAGAMAKVSPVRATNGDAVTVGGTFTGTSPTSITNSTGDGIVARNTSTGSSGLFAHATAATGATFGVFGRSDSIAGTGVAGLAAATNGTGVKGTASGGIGVNGISDLYIGVYGSSNSNIGVYGYGAAADRPAIQGSAAGNSTGVLGSSGASPDAQPKTGVYGYANQDAGSRGVYGYSGKGHGVDGRAWGGVGVYAKAQTGYALRTSGRIAADKVSGVATIPAGSTSVTVSPGVNVTSGSFVLLTPQNRLYGRDLWYTTNPGADSITLHLSSSRSYASKIAWLLMG